MAVLDPSNSMLLYLAIPLMISFPMFASAASLIDNFYFTWGDGRGKILGDGQREILSLTLDQASGSGFQSKKEYLFGKIDMQIKLVPGNSAGTVTTYYLTSQGEAHDQIDFEFLGNLSGSPYTLQTNVFSQGKGGREQQFRLWFDPSADFHTYTILWNTKNIIFNVDGAPIREFKNLESIGVPYPKKQPMRLIFTIWNAEDWATRGGSVKTDWSQAPFTTSYTNFNENACVVQYGTSNCGENANQWLYLELDETSRQKMRETQANYMIYNYCTDVKRFPQGFHPECQENNGHIDIFR